MELQNPLSDSNDSENSAETDSIQWNNEEVSDYITVTDKNGDEHHYPRIDERLTSGEFYRFCNQVNYYFGGRVGSHNEVTSTQYPESHTRFPNRYIGQSEGSPEPDIEDAKSPIAAIYRLFGAKNGWDGADGPWQEARDAFHEECEYGIEVYKANFPEAEGWTNNMTMEMVEEHNSRNWENLFLPSNVVEAFDGMPPMMIEDKEPEEDQEEQETETEEEPEEDQNQASGTLSVNEDQPLKYQVAEVLEQEPDLADERKIIMNMLDCSKTTFYDGRDMFEERQKSEPDNSEEDNQEQETETEDSNDKNEVTEQEEETDSELEDRVENLEQTVQVMKEVQENTQESLNKLSELDDF